MVKVDKTFNRRNLLRTFKNWNLILTQATSSRAMGQAQRFPRLLYIVICIFPVRIFFFFWRWNWVINEQYRSIHGWCVYIGTILHCCGECHSICSPVVNGVDQLYQIKQKITTFQGSAVVTLAGPFWKKIPWRSKSINRIDVRKMLRPVAKPWYFLSNIFKEECESSHFLRWNQKRTFSI